MTAAPTGVVLPVGYQAARDPGTARVPTRVQVRIGTRYVELTGRDAAAVWLLVHESSASGSSPEGVLSAAAESGIADSAGIYRRLLADGLLAQAITDEQLRSLARNHRLTTLLYCAGNIGEGAALAVADSTPRIRLTPWELAVYRRVPQARTIWDAVIDGAWATPFVRPEAPDELLGHVVTAVQSLIARGGAYLDLPRRRSTAEDRAGSR